MLKTFVSEMRRRNVLPTIIPYLGIAWLLLQIVATLQPMLQFPYVVNRLTAIFLFAGFPVVLYLSWYFNFTLSGLEPVKDQNTDERIPFKTRNWAVLSLIIILSGSFGFGYFDKLQDKIDKDEDGLVQIVSAKSIAVLPFRDQSPQQDQSYFSEGLSEELSSLLGKVSKLKVAASSSIFALADENLGPVEMGKRLDVEVLLSGSLRVTGNILKIRTELIDVNNGKTLWTETFSRQFKDIFSIEEEISRSIVNLLEDRYLSSGQVTTQAKTASTDAYVMYLKGREQYRKQTTESMKDARKYFEQAITLDPEYAQAYVGLADTIAMLAKGENGFGHQAFFGVLDRDIAGQLANQYIDKALLREPNLAEAYAVRGLVLAMLQDQIDDALSSLEKATAINPSLAKAHMWKFAVLDSLGRFTEAWDTLEIAYQLDPVSVANQYNRGFYLFEKGELDESESQFTQLVKDFPNNPMGYAGLASVSYTTGNISDSLKNWYKASTLSPDNANYQMQLIGMLAQLGFTQHARAMSEDEVYIRTYQLVEQDYESLFNSLNFQIDANPEDPWLYFELGWYRLIQGELKAGQQALLTSYPLFQDSELYNMPLCSPAIEIAWALQTSVQPKQADSLIQECSQKLKEAENEGISDAFFDYTAARLALLKGDPELATEKLNVAIDNGWREWWTKNDPLITPLADSPSGKALIESIDSYLEDEREKAKAFLATISQTAKNTGNQ